MSKFYGHFNKKYVGDVFDFFSGPVTVKSKLRYDPKVMALSEISRLSLHINDVIDAFKFKHIRRGDPAYIYLESRDLLHLAEYMAWAPQWNRLIIFNTLSEPHFEKQYNEKGEYITRSAKVVGFQARDITGTQSSKYLTYSFRKTNYYMWSSMES